MTLAAPTEAEITFKVRMKCGMKKENEIHTEFLVKYGMSREVSFEGLEVSVFTIDFQSHS